MKYRDLLGSLGQLTPEQLEQEVIFSAEGVEIIARKGSLFFFGQPTRLRKEREKSGRVTVDNSR